MEGKVKKIENIEVGGIPISTISNISNIFFLVKKALYHVVFS